MNVQHHPTSSAEDLDSTAELPVLDIAAMQAAAENEQLGSTDTWIIPPPPTLRTPAEIVEPTHSNADVRSELEKNLRALSSNLGDVEERLKRKVELLAENERALEAVRSERAAADKRAEQLSQELAQIRAAETAARASLAELERSRQEQAAAAQAAVRTSAEQAELSLRERSAANDALRARDQEFSARFAEHDRVLAGVRLDLTQSRARAASYFETLQSQEGRRSLFDNIFSGLQSEIDHGESLVASLQRELAAAARRTRQHETELSRRAERLTQLEKELQTLTATLARRDSELKKALDDREQLRGNLSALNETLAASVERVRLLESAAAGHTATSAVRETELQRAARERDELRSKVESLESAVSTATSLRDAHQVALTEAQGRCAELESAAGTQQRRIEQLESELGTVRAEMSQWGIALKEATTERSDYVARTAAREERVKELEARVAEQQDLVRVHQAESNASVARTREIESDLRVAEEAIHRMESDLRSKNARVDELEKTNHEWHSMVDEARVALTEREALIQRLEDEASNSSVLLGQIQQSMKRLDPASNSGTHEAMPEGATRLLIRADGATEVVHVLGRKTSIGRTPDNDLQIDAKFISRHHAVVLAGPARTIIEDLNSTNGVLVNNRRITRQVLEDGDDVIVGRTRFRFAVRQPSERRA